MKSCCTIPTKDDKPMCPSCKNTGKSVPEITLAQLVKREFQKHLKKELPYFFCKSEDCDVVYFSKEGEFIFKKGHVRVRVGIKETGKSTVAEDISQKISPI